jgi:hypothetical protein
MGLSSLPKPVSIPALRLWLGRLLIGAVVFANLQCALAFIINPSAYLQAYELTGIPGLNAVQGFGILFGMWNVPYLVALLHPHKHRLSLLEAISMQAIGLCGESYLFIKLPSGYPQLSASILRFILFDGIGLLALLIALLVTLDISSLMHSTNQDMVS